MPDWLRSAIPIIQIALAALLIFLILLQNKGVGLSSVLGGEGNVYSTKRGAERIVFYATIVVAALFFSIALLNATT